MKLKKKIKISILIFLAVIILSVSALFFLCNYFLSPVSQTYQEKNIIVETGMNLYDVSNLLKKEGIIKNQKIFYYYLKIKKPIVYAAGYYLSPNMSAKEIVEILSLGGHNTNEISITFKEGINMRKTAKIIEENTNNTYDDVMDTLKDTNYIDELINKYWFISDDIKDTNIYYPLEGYLFPNTYRFAGPDVTVKEIFNTMINEMDTILSKYKNELELNKNYSIHELLTLASIVELEGLTYDDRCGIAKVFYNRLENKMSLGSDVTTYYGAKIDIAERDLYQKEIDESNAYNTRNSSLSGHLPIGPISIMSDSSIEAVLNPSENNYYYFVSDKNGKIYFTETINEHEKIISKLQDEGLWYEW